MKLSSPAFENIGDIPSRYTCDGVNVSPPLTIHDAPEETRSFVLLIDDPDAPRGTWNHWIVFDIPAGTTVIGEGISPGTQGLNDFRRENYGGPCPPSGTHRYFFKLYALDTRLGLAPGASRADVEQAMQSHILARAVFIGRYHRQR